MYTMGINITEFNSLKLSYYLQPDYDLLDYPHWNHLQIKDLLIITQFIVVDRFYI